MISGSLAEVYKDGIPINDSLQLIRGAISNKAYKESLSRIINTIKEGKSLSEGFKEFSNLYPSFFTGIIFIGENTGNLYEVLKGLNNFYDKMGFIKSEVKKASIYPLFILFSMFILGFFFIKNIIPNFYDIYKSMQITPNKGCIFLYNLNNRFTEYPVESYIVLVSILAILLIFLKCIKSKVKIEDLRRIKIVRDVLEYMLILLFAIISNTGINISYALQYCESGIKPELLSRKLKNINGDILKGKSLTESLERSGMFSDYTLAIVKIREESGTIAEGFEEISQKLEKSITKEIKAYLSLISPIFIGIMTTGIVTFLVVFVLPLFDGLQKGIR